MNEYNGKYEQHEVDYLKLVRKAKTDLEKGKGTELQLEYMIKEVQELKNKMPEMNEFITEILNKSKEYIKGFSNFTKTFVKRKQEEMLEKYQNKGMDYNENIENAVNGVHENPLLRKSYSRAESQKLYEILSKMEYIFNEASGNKKENKAISL